MMLQLNPKTDQLNRLSAYYAAELLTKEWMQPTNEMHEIFSVTINETKSGAHGLRAVASAKAGLTHPTVTVYAVHRPDEQWSVLAINKHPTNAARLNVQFRLPNARQPAGFIGDVELVQFSREQYAWHDDGPNGHPIRSLPPAHFKQEAASFYDLPPYSLTILRGRIPD
jgi:hypothetical protein